MSLDPDRLDRAADKNESVAQKFDIKSEEIDRSTYGLDQRMNVLDTHWDGVAQSRFFEDWEEEKGKTRKYAGLLEEIASDLRSIARNLRRRAAEERERRRREEERRRREEEERQRREEEERQRQAQGG